MSREFNESHYTKTEESGNVDRPKDSPKIEIPMPQMDNGTIFLCNFTTKIVSGLITNLYLGLHYISGQKINHVQICKMIEKIVQDGGAVGVDSAVAILARHNIESSKILVP